MGTPAFRSEKLTPQLVVALWRAMSQRYASKVVSKNDSRGMKLIAGALDLIGVMDKQTFLDEYTTTIGYTIYTPFVIGDPSKVSLASQVALCAHEHRHVRQYQEGGLGFMIDYLASSSSRANYEMQAFQANMEIYQLLRGDPGNPARFAANLRAYNCSDGDIAYVEKSLRLTAHTIRQGALVGTVAFATQEAHDVAAYLIALSG